MADRPSPPWTQNLPPGGEVIYTSETSKYGFYGYPARIVRVGGTCITESWDGERWALRESGPCAMVPAAT